MTEEYKFREMETERLKLIKLAPEHLDDMYAYASDEETVQHMSWPRHESREKTAWFINLTQELYDGEMHYDWAIWHREDSKMIGTIGLHALDRKINGAEFGYIIAKPYWGQGLVVEAARHLLRFCFEDLELSIMKAYCDPANRGSERVMQKLGMTYGGTELYKLIKDPEPVMHKWYFIGNEELRIENYLFFFVELSIAVRMLTISLDSLIIDHLELLPYWLRLMFRILLSGQQI